MAGESSIERGDADCPQWGTLLFINGHDTWGNFNMGVKEASPPGISGTAQMALGLTKRPISVTGTMVAADKTALGVLQLKYEAACESFSLDKFFTSNGRTFDNVRFVNINWTDGFSAVDSAGCKYSATLEQIIPAKAVP